jgi:hypothetical protein
MVMRRRKKRRKRRNCQYLSELYDASQLVVAYLQ